MGRWALVAVTALGAAVRFLTLDAQSFWFDEALTIGLLQLPFAEMVQRVVETQAQPPLYFILARGWVEVFGLGEVGLRSFSALLGTLLVPVAWAIGDAVGGRRIALPAALLTAISPPLVWYSQEARSYALFALLAGLALLLFLRALEEPGRRALTAWAVVSLLAVASHYFALFPAAAEAAVLLWRLRRRAVGSAVLLGAGLVALAPLLLYQRAHGDAEWIGIQPLPPRVANTITFLTTGPSLPQPLPPAGEILAPVLAALVLGGLVLAVRYTRGRSRDRTLLLIGVGGAVIAVPMLAAFAGNDFVFDRNFLAAWVPLATAVTVGLCVFPRRRLGQGALAGIAVVYLATIAWFTVDPDGRRDDWRGAAEALGPPRADRLVTVAPYWEALALQVYRGSGLRPAAQPQAASSVVTITKEGFVPWGDDVERVAPGPPFEETRRWRLKGLTVTEYAAPRRVTLRPEQLSTRGRNGAFPFAEPRLASSNRP